MYKNKLSTEDEGVSPVVGVILMVAIVVILSALLATTVLNIGGTQEPAQAGVQTSITEHKTGQGYVAHFTWTTNQNADSVIIRPTGDYPSTTELSLTAVGQTKSTSRMPTGKHYSIVGTLDGRETVIMDYTLEHSDATHVVGGEVTTLTSSADGVIVTPANAESGWSSADKIAQQYPGTISTDFQGNEGASFVVWNVADSDGDGTLEYSERTTKVGEFTFQDGMSVTLSGNSSEFVVNDRGETCGSAENLVVGSCD